MTIADVHLVRKEGGKSGVWTPSGRAQKEVEQPKTEQPKNTEKNNSAVNLQNIVSAVVTVSDRCSQGTAEDTSGPAIFEWLKERGVDVRNRKIIPDEKSQIQMITKNLVNEGHRLIVFTGGTDSTKRSIKYFKSQLQGKSVSTLKEVFFANVNTPDDWREVNDEASFKLE